MSMAAPQTLCVGAQALPRAVAPGVRLRAAISVVF